MGRVSSCALFYLFPDRRRMSSEAYNYPPLNSDEYYIPPRKNHTGDLDCDCNTVMYKCEVRIRSSDPPLIYLRQVFTWHALRVSLGQRSTREI